MLNVFADFASVKRWYVFQPNFYPNCLSKERPYLEIALSQKTCFMKMHAFSVKLQENACIFI